MLANFEASVQKTDVIAQMKPQIMWKIMPFSWSILELGI